MKFLRVLLLCLALPATASFAQNVNVEPGAGSYPTLKAAFDAINLGTHTGAVTVDIVADTTETAPAVLNASGVNSASYTSILIRPSGGARTISGAITGGSPLIDLNGADNVTIDGLNASGHSLTISNTTVSATTGTSTIRFITDATNNTVTNCTVLGSSTAALGTLTGNIVFGAGAITAGNDSNTISSCNLGPAGSNLPTKLITFTGSTNTDPGTANSGITISNNNFFDYFGATVSSAGIDVNSGTVGTTISNNRFYQSATRTMTSTALTHSAIRISNTSGNAYQVTGNTIGSATNTGTGISTFVLPASTSGGIIPINLSVGTTTATSVQGNTVAGFAISGAASGTGSSAPFRAIYVGSGIANVGDVTGNTVGSMSATGSITYASSSSSTSDVIGIYNFGTSSWTANNNNVGGITASSSGTGAANVYGIRVNTGSGVTFTCNNNTVGGTVANSISSTSTATGTIVNGIRNENPIGTLTGNTVRNLTAAAGTGTAASASVGGIVMNNSANNTLSQNTIFNLANTNATAATSVTGIQFSGSGTANVVERNLIYGLTTATTSTSAEVNGIRIGAGTTVYRNNMIAIGAGIPNAIGAAATNSSTAGISGINEVLGTNSIWHNSVYIGGSPTAGTGSSYAFNGVQTTNTRSFRNNIFYNGRSNNGATGKHYAIKINGTTANPSGLTINNNVYFVNGTGGVFGFFNSVDVPDLATWKTAVGQDANSLFGDPQYVAPTAATPDLHINPSAPSPAEGTGADVGVANDFDGQVRANLTPVDIGADAGNFTSAGDIAPPSISYTPLSNTSSTADRTVNATVSDNVGVTAVQIYFRKGNSGTYSSSPCTMTGGSATNGTYSCTISNSTVGGVAPGETIQYFVVAQDAAGNITSSPSGAAGTSVTNLTAFPANPNSYTIVGSISGGKTVGAGGDYATLGAAIADLNSREMTGPVVFSLTDATYAETAPITINANGGSSATNTVTIKPNVAGTTITGSAATALIVLNGADYVIIDGSSNGSTSRDMTMTNTNAGTSSAVIWMQTAGTDGATNNIVKNVNVVGNSNTTTLIGVGSGSSTIGLSSLGNGNNANTIQNNNISKVQYGIYSQGASAAAKNTGNTIMQNLMNTASPNNVGRGGIMVGFENNIQISQNRIDGIVFSTSSVDALGISLGFVGANPVSNTTTAGNEVTNATVSRNAIGAVSHTSTYSAIGIAVSSATSGTNQISNNFVSGVIGNGTSGDFAAGIYIGGGVGSTTQIYFNSVSMSGTLTGTSGVERSYALAIQGNNPLVDVRNNILSNTQVISASTVPVYAIGLQYSTYSNLTSDYNDLFTSTGSLFKVGRVGNLDDTGTDQTLLSDWRTTTGKDANSKSVEPLFTSLADLHLQAGSTLIDMGQAIAGVTVDFDGQTRPNGLAVEIGADEFTPSPGTLQFSFATYSGTEAGMMATITVTRAGGSSGAASVDYGTSDGTATGGGACGGSVDYVTTSGTLTWADGDAASKTFTVTLCNDGVTEANESINLTLTNPVNATLGSPSAAVLTVIDSVTFSGSVDVGAGQTYTSLTNPGGIFEAINNGAINGNTTINITSDLTGETGTVALNQFAGGATLTIKPAGAPRTITSTTSATNLIVLNGADNVIIDGSLVGGADRSLSVINANSTASGTTVVAIISGGVGAGATGNVIKNTTIQNGATFSASTTLFNFGIYVNGADNDNLTVQNNLIQRANVGMQIFGATPGLLDNLVIQDNTLGGAVAADFIGLQGMILGQATGATVTRNTVRNILFTGSLNGGGIFCSTGFVNSTVTRNTINNMEASASGGYGMTGIYVTTGTATSNLTIANNFIYDIRGTSFTSGGLGDTVVGIRIAGTNTGGVKVYFNSVNLFGNYSGFAGASITAAFMVHATTPTGLDVRDNIFANTFNNSSRGDDKNYAIYTNSANTMFTDINYNDYWVGTNTTTGPGVLGAINSTDRTSLAALQTGTGKDAQSKNVNPAFTSSTDLHLTAASPLNAMGVAIAGITTDIDGDTRSATPDIGADEITVAGSVQFGSATYSVSEGAGTVTIDVTRTSGADGAASVNFTTVDGTAVSGAGNDYTGQSGTLTWADGDAGTKQITVTILNDAVFESDETFTLNLTGAMGASLGSPAETTVTITNDDTAPAFAISDVTMNEGNSGTTSFTFTVTKNNATALASSVDFQTADGTATVADGDYQANSGTLTFQPGDTTKEVTVAVNGDTAFEANETFTVTLSNAMNATISDSSGTGTITNDETAPTVQFNMATYTVDENDATATLTITKTGDTTLAASVDYATSDGSATAPADYTATSGTVTFAANETSKNITVPINQDTTFEGNENFNVTLSNPSNATLGAQSSATVTITDDDSLPLVQFSASNYDVSEAGTSVTITVTKTGSSALPSQVNYATSDGSATAGQDYTAQSGMLTFLPNETEKTFTVPITQDTVFEGNENFMVTLSMPVGAAIGSPNPATVTILEDDTAPSLAISDVTQAEGNSGTSSFTFTVTKSGSTAVNATAEFTTSNGTATTADGDYVANSGTVTFTSSETSKQITVTVNGDKKVEGDETFTVELTMPTNASISDASGTGTITNDDAAPTAAPVSVMTEENTPKTVTLSATDSNGDALTFSIVTPPSNGTLGTISSPNCSSGTCTATVEYTPNTGYTGNDSFTYRASDGVNDSNTATVTIAISHVVPVVTSTADSGPGSLRRALASALNGDTITFNIGSSPQVIELTSGSLTINKNITLAGPGANNLTIRRGGTTPFRIFVVTNGSGTGPVVTISGLTIENGDAGTPVAAEGTVIPVGSGGAIYNDHGTLTIDSCAFTNNKAQLGGAIYNEGAGSTASLAVIRSTFEANTAAGGFGGAIYNAGSIGNASTTVDNSTFSGNTAANGFGGAIFNDGTDGIATMTIRNSTLTATGTINVIGVLLYNDNNTGNTATITIGNTILNNSGSAGANVVNNGGTVTSLGYNVSSDAGGPFMSGPGDQSNTDPILGPLKLNGGTTETHMPLSNSPAIDRGKNLSSTATDQRGVTRPVNYDATIVVPANGDRSDIGAVELLVGVQPASAVSRKNHGMSGAFDIGLPISGPVAIECRSGGASGDYQLVLTFATPISHNGAAVTNGTGTVVSPTVTGEAADGTTGTVTINLTGVTNAQRLTVALFNVNDGTRSGDVGIRVGIVMGDVTSDGTVGASDISSVKSEAGQAATATNFRNDVTSNGIVTASDIGFVKAQSGQALPPAPTRPETDPR